jgi:hypothetical protein
MLNPFIQFPKPLGNYIRASLTGIVREAVLLPLIPLITLGDPLNKPHTPR